MGDSRTVCDTEAHRIETYEKFMTFRITRQPSPTTGIPNRNRIRSGTTTMDWLFQHAIRYQFCANFTLFVRVEIICSHKRTVRWCAKRSIVFVRNSCSASVRRTLDTRFLLHISFLCSEFSFFSNCCAAIVHWQRPSAPKKRHMCGNVMNLESASGIWNALLAKPIMKRIPKRKMLFDFCAMR